MTITTLHGPTVLEIAELVVLVQPRVKTESELPT